MTRTVFIVRDVLEKQSSSGKSLPCGPPPRAARRLAPAVAIALKKTLHNSGPPPPRSSSSFRSSCGCRLRGRRRGCCGGCGRGRIARLAVDGETGRRREGWGRTATLIDAGRGAGPSRRLVGVAGAPHRAGVPSRRAPSAAEQRQCVLRCAAPWPALAPGHLRVHPLYTLRRTGSCLTTPPANERSQDCSTSHGSGLTCRHDDHALQVSQDGAEPSRQVPEGSGAERRAKGEGRGGRATGPADVGVLCRRPACLRPSQPLVQDTAGHNHWTRSLQAFKRASRLSWIPVGEPGRAPALLDRQYESQGCAACPVPRPAPTWLLTPLPHRGPLQRGQHTRIRVRRGALGGKGMLLHGTTPTSPSLEPQNIIHCARGSVA